MTCTVRVVARDDWFRSADWGIAAKAEFEARLARARPRSRPQYRRIKALTLLDTGDPVKQAAGRDLLELTVVDRDSFEFERVAALSILGAHEQDTNLLDAAERHLRAALDLIAVHPSGGTELEEVRLAEILLKRGSQAALKEARDLIDRVGTSRPVLLSSRFRKCLAGVRVALALGQVAQAKGWARQALSLASATHSGLANHPRLGLVETDDATRAWLAMVIHEGPATSQDPAEPDDIPAP